MVSTLQLQEKYNKIRKNFCFYLDIPNSGLSRSISKRLQDMGLREELVLSSRVTHVVGAGGASGGGAGGASGGGASGASGGGAGGASGGGAARARCARRDAARARADAMLERLRQPPHPPHTQHTQHAQHQYVHITVQKAITLLDKLYDTFFTAPRKAQINLFSKHFIKIEFLDKLCRPVYKEFDEWPQISLEPDPPKEKKERKDSTDNQKANTVLQNKNITGQKMTRRNRPRIKEKEEKEQKGGYCEMCNADYTDAALHRRSPHHLAFVRDHTNFLALDSLISSGTDVATFLDKATPVNGERRSLRKICNGEAEPKSKRSKRSQSPDSTVNGNQSPKRNGNLDEKRSTRCSKKSSESQISEDRQYYKVVGVSNKLRSSGGFASKRKDSLPTCNGTKPLVVKFRKVRRSELSVLSDEAEQFMFPKRASSTSSSSSDEDEKEEPLTKRRTPPTPPQTVSMERQRLARPVALKEESSEEDSWPEDNRRRKRRAPVAARRGRRVPCRGSAVTEPPKSPVKEPVKQEEPPPEAEISPIRDDNAEKCLKWEDGRLKYTPAVEQLEFAFESVPHSEPWFETFKRQDQDKVVTKNVPKYFSLYAKSPKLPYEIGQLPPLKPNCCHLSDLVRRDDKPGPSRSYGTRGMKKQRIRKRTAALMALEGHPRKSPREHASTLAILGSAGLLHRRKHAEDTKSTASEDTISDTQSNIKVEPVLSETQEASERLQQFLSEVFEDAAEFDMSDELIGGDTAVIPSTNVVDMSSLVSECEDCDIIRNEINQDVARKRGRRGRFKKKNKTGWPTKKKQKKDSRGNSLDTEQKADSSLDRSSAEPPDDTASEDDTIMSETEREDTLKDEKSDSQDTINNTITVENIEELSLSKCESMDVDTESRPVLRSEGKPVHFDLKVVLHDNVQEKLAARKETAASKRASRSSASETEEKEDKVRKKRTLHALGDWLQPVVRVARVDGVARRLRSAGRTRTNRLR